MSATAPPATDPEERPLRRSHLTFPVVGSGASAGGLAALRQFFTQMPAHSGMAFVVILHLSPNHESNAAEILQRLTHMPVVQVVEPVPIEADHVYIIPPTSDLMMDDGGLRLREAQRIKGGVHSAIDLFFRTLAQVHGERGIAVVLSGTGSDGAVGLSRVKDAGGITMAQTPDDAEYDGMPRAAIATGMADIVLPVNDMPQRLLDLWSNMRRIRMPADIAESVKAQPEILGDGAAEAEAALADIMKSLRLQTRHDFTHYKRATVLRRIERRLQVTATPDISAYRQLVAQNADETRSLLQDLLISVTNFFRDREAFEALECAIVPTLFANRPGDDPVRVWVAGCATGEEAYSVAMLLREQQKSVPGAPDFQVFATDIDERAIAVARAGVYPGAIVTDVPPARIRQFFVADGEGYRVVKALREKVLFAAHNVLRDPPFSRVDLVCCRNLLIYLDRRAQTTVLDMFRFGLKPDGALFLGVSESPDAAADSFVAVDKKHRIFRASRTAPLARSLPVLASPGSEGRTIATAQLPSEPKLPSSADVHRRALEELLPPSALVDAQGRILHLSDGAGAFMEHGSGPPSNNLLDNVSAPLRLELRAALFTATQKQQHVTVRNLRLERGEQIRAVHLSVRPFRGDDGAELALVVFDESDDAADAARALPPEVRSSQLFAQQEGENLQLKEHLQESLEQAETSREEMMASNEELQAINEELRSATEELETSKEELQSTNEELTTVNYELKLKVEETSLVNDDLQNLVVSSDIATVFVDRALQIKRFTPRAAQLFNLIASDIGRSLLDITHKLDYPSLAVDARQAFVALQVIERSVRGVDGRHFLARFLPYRTAEDQIVGAVLNFVDVTALNAAEQKAVAGEERLRIAAEATRDFAIITLDDAGLVTAWNAGAARMFQWQEKEILGQPIELIFTDEDRARGAPEAELEGARKHGRAEDERWHQRKDGSTFYVSGVMSSLAPAGERGFAKIARDMTTHKQLVQAQDLLLAQEQAMRRQAQTAVNLKDEFLAVMSHELKHPLNLIHVNAELLSRSPEARGVPAVVRASQAIRRAATNQAKIIDDLLDLSRVRTGKMALRIADVLLNDCVNAIYQAALADARAREIDLVLEGTDEPLRVHGDEVRIEQIIWNLVSNAIKFTPDGGTVNIGLQRDDTAGRAQLTVRDTGRGIEPEFLPHVFEMFSQEGLARGPNERGLGIGLALVHELVMAQGGEVSADSAGIGKGSVFTVLLPLSEARKGADSARGSAEMENPLAGLRILLVDDSKETRELFAELLAYEGAKVDIASGGIEGLQLLAGTAYDLLISDLGMPGMSGFEFIAQARELPEIKLRKALALSGFGRDADAQKALQAGFDGHLSKPTTIEALQDLLRSLDEPSTA
ncbi:MAG: chemotaxis protein CheB [Variovorax sp.]